MKCLQSALNTNFGRGTIMTYSKKACKKSFTAILALLLACPAFAQYIDLGKFKGVEIRSRLKFQDTVVEKGTYDLEALKNRTSPACYLRIKKGRKILCLIEGEQLDYENYGTGKMSDPSIPDKLTLKMKKDPKEKIFYFFVETGKSAHFAFLKLKFKMDYED
jgi:hypothetical protein